MYEPQVETWVPAAAAEVAEALQKDLAHKHSFTTSTNRVGLDRDRVDAEYQYTPDEDPLLNTMAQFDTEVGTIHMYFSSWVLCGATVPTARPPVH